MGTIHRPSIPAERRQYYQIVEGSGLSADYVNKPMHALDPAWGIDGQGSNINALREEIQKRIRALQTYTQYAQRRAESSTSPEIELTFYVNDDNRDRVAQVDQLVLEIKARVERPIPEIQLAQLFVIVEKIYELVMARPTTFKIIQDLLEWEGRT